MKKEEKQQILLARLYEMQEYERGLREKGVKLIAGMDEVGRGPLAGPVVAAAVILPENFSVLGVDDSKKLSEKRREQLFDEIREAALAYCIGVVDNHKIDKINILEATKLAMKQAIYGLSDIQNLSSDLQRNSDFQKSSLNGLPPEHILIDALSLKDVDIPQTAIIKGDSKSVSIAAASILAKVTRDRMMAEYHKTYPDYAFDKNKGYGTKAHYEGIKKAGICPLHRRTFLHLQDG